MKRILISGAGIAGLALAASLEKFNLKVDVIEKCSYVKPVGAAICLPANATACLKHLGVLNEILSDSFLVKVWQVFTDDGAHLCDIMANNFKQDMPFISIERKILHEKLIGLCKKTNFQFNTEIQDIFFSDTKVSVFFKNGQKEKYDLVIGADGIYSKTRSFLAPDIQVSELGAICWRSIIKRPLFLNQPQFFMGKNRFLLLHPISEQKAYCGAIVKEQEILGGTSLERFKFCYNDIYKPISEFLFSEITEDKQLLEKKIETLSDISWGNKRVILIGDAAHACAPSMQQGGSQALEDALVLSDIIGSEYLENVAEKFKLKRSNRVAFIFNKSNVATKKMITLQDCEIDKRNLLIRQKGLENFNLWNELFVDNPEFLRA